MKRYIFGSFILAVAFLALSSCATYPPDRYNTQRGAMIGAGTGALIGQAIGGDTEGTLIGMAAGTILGGLMGNAVDQDYQAARDAGAYSPSNVETFPAPVVQWDNCRRVTKRVWQNGVLVGVYEEEICSEPSTTVVVRPNYIHTPPPRVYWQYPWGGGPHNKRHYYHYPRYPHWGW